MNESPINCHGNPAYDEDDDKPTSLKFCQLKEITNQTREFDHSSHNHCNPSEVLNPGNARPRPAQGSSRALFVLVIIVSLISLVALLLTLLMLVGKIGSLNEGQCTG